MSEQKFGMENSTQFVPAKCTACGGELEVDPKQETAVCRYCGETFVVSKAVNNYNVEHNTYNTNIVNERKGDMDSMLNFISDREDKKYARAQEQKAERSKRNKTLLWALGWIFIFPVPLTILMLRNKKLADKARYGIIAAAWVVYILLLVVTRATGDKDSDKAEDVSSETSSAAESEADDIDLDAIVDKLKDSETAHIIFHCPQYLMNDVADSFGTDVRADPIADGMMEVRVKAGEADMLHWAVKYAESVEVLAHERLRRRIAETLREALKKYDG